MASATRVWERYGETDPYYGVLVSPNYRRKPDGEVPAAFFDSGDSSVAGWLQRIESVVGPVSRGVALDFGAGVGRLSLALATRFENVFSVDVSAGMLRELTRNAERLGRSNIQPFARVDLAPATVDFAFSQLVFQHIPVPEGMKQLRSLWSRLKPGGVLAVEVPIKSSHSPLVQALRRVRDALPILQYPYNALRGRPLLDGGMQMNVYSANELLLALFDCGAADVRVLYARPDAAMHGGMFVARKPLARAL